MSKLQLDKISLNNLKSIRADIYFNLHKKKLSVRSMDREKSYRRVIAHRTAVLMKDCNFIVSEAGRQRVLRERRKNVHAFVRGEWVIESDNKIFQEPLDSWVLVKYNPYTRDRFWVVETNEPIESARFVIINGKDMLALI